MIIGENMKQLFYMSNRELKELLDIMDVGVLNENPDRTTLLTALQSRPKEELKAGLERYTIKQQRKGDFK